MWTLCCQVPSCVHLFWLLPSDVWPTVHVAWHMQNCPRRCRGPKSKFFSQPEVSWCFFCVSVVCLFVSWCDNFEILSFAMLVYEGVTPHLQVEFNYGCGTPHTLPVFRSAKTQVQHILSSESVAFICFWCRVDTLEMFQRTCNHFGQFPLGISSKRLV